jgi:tetratricopeptide (TPR) repeat protein
MRAKLLLPLLLLAAVGPSLAAVDPFYLSLLRDGQLAFDRKDFATAARNLHLACFGMLEEPRPLADCLARLALAQDRAEDLDGFRDTFQRLVEVEDRFSAYSQGGVAPELRAVLEPRLVARLPTATLENVPVFRPLVAKKSDPKKPETATAAPKKTETAAGKPEAAEVVVKKPDAPPAAVTKNPASPSAPGPSAPPSAVPAPSPAPAVKPPAPAETPAETKPETKPAATKPVTEAERKKMDQARQLLSQERPAKELRQAFQLAREVADAHPDAREPQHLAAEAAYRISRWSDAAAYFRRGGDPGDAEPERLFYMAVSLQESGDSAAAAAALKRALPNLRRTPYVDTYAKKILGQ